MPCEGRLRDQVLLSLEKRWLQGRPDSNHFTVGHHGKMRDSRHKLEQEKRQDRRKHFFILGTVKNWSWLPRKVI